MADLDLELEKDKRPSMQEELFVEELFATEINYEHGGDGAHRLGRAEKTDAILWVDWDSPNDPENPQAFTRLRKLIITLAISQMTLTTSFASSVFSATGAQVALEFGVSNELMIMGTSLFMLGLGVGPTIFGPLSELYGRRIPLFSGFTLFVIFQIPVAVAQNVQTVLIGRFFQGLFGSAPVAVVGGALADIWDARERGFAMPFFAGSLFVGPIFGPILGAYITASFLGWRWTEWINAIMAALFGVIGFFCIPETYAPVLLLRRAKRLRCESGNESIRASHEDKEVNLIDIANRYLLRPAKMLALEPILSLITIYMAFVFGLVYLTFEAFPFSYIHDRGWSPGLASLPFISILVGVIGGCVLLAVTTRTRLAPNPAEGRVQETRLLLMIAGACFLPAGLFWFAWTSFQSLSPWPQIISGVPMGFGIILINLQGLNYIIDSYTINANSAIAANTLMRCLFAAGFPLFAGAMYRQLGVQWASTVLACVSTALIPVPLLFYKFGARIRKLSRYVPT